MPLESLNNEQINIHDLTLEEEKKPESEALRLYENLKETPLYDEERQQWNFKMDKDQTPIISKRFADVQLLGILVESQFDKSSAQKLHDALKDTQLYDSAKNQWKAKMNENQVLEDQNRESDAQLINILVESQFNLELAKKSYETLKTTPLYDAKRNQWNKRKYEWNNPHPNKSNSMRSAEDQLLGILVEAQFNKSSAQESHETLKKTVLYDSKLEQWNFIMNEDQTMEDIVHHSKYRHAAGQLLEILIEAQFDKTSAKNLYEKLKKTELYDKEKEQWNWAMNEKQELRDSDRITRNQLLGILCEKEFEENKPNLNNNLPLPEERNY